MYLFHRNLKKNVDTLYQSNIIEVYTNECLTYCAHIGLRYQSIAPSPLAVIVRIMDHSWIMEYIRAELKSMYILL